MGTRNLTIVKIKGKTKVAQYGQWDGYPTGQGQTIADFLKKADLPKFRKQVEKLGTYTPSEIKQAYREAGDDGLDDWVSSDIADKVKQTHPALSRDYGAGILELIHEGKVVKVVLDEGFKNDTLFCEYWYEIDLDKNSISMNGGEAYSFEAWCKDGFMKKLEDLENKD